MYIYIYVCVCLCVCVCVYLKPRNGARGFNCHLNQGYEHAQLLSTERTRDRLFLVLLLALLSQNAFNFAAWQDLLSLERMILLR